MLDEYYKNMVDRMTANSPIEQVRDMAAILYENSDLLREALNILSAVIAKDYIEKGKAKPDEHMGMMLICADIQETALNQAKKTLIEKIKKEAEEDGE